MIPTYNRKLKLKDYLEIFNNIEKLYIPEFSFDGNFLKEQGVQEGVLIGKILKMIEKEWVSSDFQISNKRVLEIIKTQNN